MNDLSDELHTLIQKLIDTHGEFGICPTRADWTAILKCPADKPLNVLNLLQFKPEVATPQGTVSGQTAYGHYVADVGPAFARAGGKSLYHGKVNHMFGTVAGPDWHVAILTQYPTPLALANFWLDPEFVAAHSHRVHGVEQSRVLVMNSLRGGY